MAYKFIYYPTGYNSTLDYKEEDELKGYFPNLNASNIHKLGPSTRDYKFSVFEKTPLPDLCVTYGCNTIISKKYIEIT